MDAFEILVVILSVALAVFLVLGIVLVVYLLKVAKSVKHISEKAATAVDNVSNTAATIGKFVTPATVGKLLVDTIQKAVRNHKKKDD